MDQLMPYYVPFLVDLLRQEKSAERPGYLSYSPPRPPRPASGLGIGLRGIMSGRAAVVVDEPGFNRGGLLQIVGLQAT